MPDDPVLLEAARAAAKELTKRERETLEQALVEDLSIEEIARANLISHDRTREWVQNAFANFIEKLGLQCDRLGVRERPETDDDYERLAITVLAPDRPAVEEPSKIRAPAPITSCPKCNAPFHDPSGQFGAYAKLAKAGQVALMIGCTTCSILFAPITQAEIATLLPGQRPPPKRKPKG